MALALLGNIASQLLPHAINWGMSKLRDSNIGRGSAKNVNYLLNKGAKLAKNKTFKRVISTIGD
jgi:hypothetical protein